MKKPLFASHNKYYLGFFLTLSFLLFFGRKTTHAQTTSGMAQKVSISVQEKPIKHVLLELDSLIEEKFAFFEMPELEEVVSVNADQQPLDSILKLLLDERGIEYILRNQTIILRKKKREVALSGSIRDAESKKQLGFATISVKGRSVGTVSSPEGTFFLALPKAYQRDTLVVSMAGYDPYFFTLEDVSDKGRMLDISLEPKTTVLQQITVLSQGDGWIQLKPDPTLRTKSGGFSFFGKFISNAEYTVETDNCEIIRIDCGAGKLHLKPSENRELKIKADIRTNSISQKAHEDFVHQFLDLGVRPEGNTLFVRSFFKIEEIYKNGRWHLPTGKVLSSPTSFIDLTVYIPSQLMVHVDDGSGQIIIENLNNDLALKDGSGGIEISDHFGALQIYDKSGNLKIRNLTGNLNLRDASGSIDLRNIKGDIDLKDASGNIYLRNIGVNPASVIKIRDASGSITASELVGDLVITDRSGKIQVKDMDGMLIISDRTGKVEHSNINGEVKVKK